MDPFDLTCLFARRALLLSVDLAGPPRLHTITPVLREGPVALLPGSFNPPTAAHVHLAERVVLDGYARIVFTFAVRTAGKQPNGLIPEDRLALLERIAGQHLSVAVCSHGLYADQAEAATAAFGVDEVSFLVGSDKLIQIFEDRWYDDRDEALERLFARARIIVAPRSDQGERLGSVLRAPENRRFADRVDVLRLHPAVSELSSTHVRGLLRSGADPAGLVPPPVAAWLEEMRAFAPPITIGCEEIDAYAMRVRVIDSLWATRASEADLRIILIRVMSDTEDGARLRAVLDSGDVELFAHVTA